MAIDERYQDNLVITKDAFQNLLTNIKNYPIIDIDYITETDTDELHGDQIWQNYTEGMPCIKITYGDDRTTKGNIIFAEEQRVLINKYKKILNQLTVWLNENERLYNRWKKIYELNYRIYEEKTDQINRFFARFASIETNKLAFLKAGWNLLQYNLVDLFNPEINDSRDTTLLRVSSPKSFSYQEFLSPDNFDYKKALIPQNGNNQIVNNLEYIILNEEQKAKIITTLYLLRDILVGDEEDSAYFFNEQERAAINSFINFIASYNYFSVLEAVGLAGYDYTSDQILIIKQGKVQVNNSNRVATFEKVSSSATFRDTTSYYKPATYSIYVNVGNNAEYNGNTSYYIINNSPNSTSAFYELYECADETDFNSKKHLLYTKEDHLLCYQLVENLNATTFENQKDNLYIQTSNGEPIEQAVRNILPQIVDDLVWSDLDNINLSFDSMFFDFSSNITNIVNTMKQAVGPRLTYILTYLDYYGANILSARTFKIINNSITVSENEETVYMSNPNTSDDIIADHLLDQIIAIEFKIEIVNELIRKCNQLIQDIATGKKDKQGNDITEGENRILYGYKYVKVGSNITYDDTYFYSSRDGHPEYRQAETETIYRVGKDLTATTLEKKETAINDAGSQASGTYRITINGHVYEVPIKGFGAESNQPITLSTSSTLTTYSKGNTIIRAKNNSGQLQTITLDGHITVTGTSTLTGDVTLGTENASSDLLPGKNNEGTLGSTSKYWNNIYVTNIGDSSHTISNAYITNLTAINATITNLNLPAGGDGDAAFNLKGGTTAQFLRGNGSNKNPVWSNTLTGSFTLSGSSSNLSVGGAATITGATSISGVVSITNSTAASSTSTGALKVTGGIGCQGYIYGSKVFGAVFNDYAEYRTTINLTPGHVVIDQDDGSLTCSATRLQPGAQVISDTFGHSMGETDIAKTPIAVAGRVLVYTYQPRENYHAGMAVCSAPDGTVDIMTREEIRDYPDCIVGIVSEIPQYETWGSDNVKVDGRIWIKVR